jgi:hypothetical protein
VPALTALEKADQALSQQNPATARVQLSIFQDREPQTYALVRAALMRKHLRNINPELAAVFDNPNFVQKDASKAALADSSLKTATPDGKVMPVSAAGMLTFANQYVSNFAASVNQTPSDDALKASAGLEIQGHQDRQKALDDDYVKNRIAPPLGINQGNKQYRTVDQHVANYRVRHQWEKDNVKVDDYKNASDHAKTMVAAYTFDYTQFNNPLRGDLTPGEGEGQFGKANMALTQGITSGLNELPAYEKNVYRHDKVFNGFDQLRRVGAVMTDMAVISATREASSLKLIAGSGNAEVLSIIRSKTGRFAKPLSQYNARHSDENEVIFRPGTRFRIVKRFDATLNHGGYQFSPDMDAELQSVLNADHEKATIKHVLYLEEM